MAETLKFGPEWLRNLSSDTHCRPQSPSAPTSRFKLAEHRYTKEEMLELFDPDLDAPHDLKLTSKVFVEKAIEPVGFTAPSDTEQKLLAQMSSNNTPSSRPPPSQQMRPTLSLSQLRNSESIRKTRGSGRLDPIYYRSSTMDDDDYVRTRHFNRDPCDDSIPSSRGRGGGYSGRSFDDPSDVSRSMVAESWRGPKKKWNDDDTGNWRKQLPSQKPTNRSWREPWENSRTRGSDDPFKEKIFKRSFSSSHAQNNYDDELELPEWSTDDFGGVGTFDATGAFMSVKELERIEEQRGQSKESDDNSNEGNRNASFEAETPDEPRSKESSESRDVPIGNDADPPDFNSDVRVAESFDKPEEVNEIQREVKVTIADCTRMPEPVCPGEPGNSFLESVVDPIKNGAGQDSQISSLFAGMSLDVENLVDSIVMAGHEEENSSVGDSVGAPVIQEDAITNYLQIVAQQKQFQQQLFNHQQHPQYQPHNHVKGFVTPDHEDAYRWFYRDPQGDIQGPFTSLQMCEWFSVGYFNMSLLVKQGRDNNFLPIGTLVKLIGSNPFQIPPQASSAMSHLKAQVSAIPEPSLDLQQAQHLSQQFQQLQLKQQQLDQLKTMQLMQMNPSRNEILNKLSTLQLLQTLQQQQQLQNNSSRPLMEALNVQSVTQGGDNGSLSSLHHQLIQQHLQKQQQQQLSQYLQQQQLGTFPHRSFSQSSNNDAQPPFIGGTSASNSASFLLQANQTSVPQQVAPAWKAGNDVGSYSSKNWEKGLMGLELSRPITAQALEQLQYLALEKQQQRIDSLATGGLGLNGDQSNQLDGLSMGGVREHQLRALLQQEATRLMTLDDRQRMVGPMELLERQKQEELRRRQEKAEVLKKLQQQEQLETFKKLKQQQQQGKPTIPNSVLNLNSMQRQGQQLQRGSSPNFQSTSAINHQLEGVLNFQQQQSLMQKQQVNKSWSLTNQNWPNGSAVDMNWGNSSYSQSQFMAPPSHSTTTSFTNTTSDLNHLSGEPFLRSRLFGSSLPSSSANNIWLDGSCENHGFTGIASQQQQALGSNNNLMGNSFDKSPLIVWCESELKDQVPNGNIPSIIQQLLECSVLPEILNIVKAFFSDVEKAAGFAKNFIDRRNRLGLRKCELPHLSTAAMLS